METAVITDSVATKVFSHERAVKELTKGVGVVHCVERIKLSDLTKHLPVILFHPKYKAVSDVITRIEEDDTGWIAYGADGEQWGISQDKDESILEELGIRYEGHYIVTETDKPNIYTANAKTAMMLRRL
jgi:hypothetical protein